LRGLTEVVDGFDLTVVFVVVVVFVVDGFRDIFERFSLLFVWFIEEFELEVELVELLLLLGFAVMLLEVVAFLDNGFEEVVVLFVLDVEVVDFEVELASFGLLVFSFIFIIIFYFI